MEPIDSTAALIIIGNEILSGRTQDKNLSVLGQILEQNGIRLAHACVIADEETQIISALRRGHKTAKYVFTTGGIGPTHDDITTTSVAEYFGRRLIRYPEAVKSIQARCRAGIVLNEARLKMADLPKGAKLLTNPISGAPGFRIDNVFVLPGVPDMVKAMLPEIVAQLAQGVAIYTESLTTTLAESEFAQALSDIQNRYPDVSIGSYPRKQNDQYHVNLELKSTDSPALTEAKQLVEEMLSNLKH